MIRYLPNLISLMRLVLVPVVLRAIWVEQYGWALAWSAVAGVSDGLDGFLARRLRATSRTGAYLDPVADKVLLSGTYLTLGLDRAIPWWLTAVVFGRDLIMLLFLGAAILFTHLREFKPTVWGKLSTAVQIVTVLVILVNRAIHIGEFALFFENVLIVLTLAATSWSAVHYAWVAAKMLRGERREPRGRSLDSRL